MCKASGKNIHWCWRYSSGRTNLGRSDRRTDRRPDGRTDGAQIIIPIKIFFLVGDNIGHGIYFPERGKYMKCPNCGAIVNVGEWPRDIFVVIQNSVNFDSCMVHLQRFLYFGIPSCHMQIVQIWHVFVWVVCVCFMIESNWKIS